MTTSHFIVIFPEETPPPDRPPQWYWHKKSTNGEKVSDGEGYTREHDAIRGAFDANPEIEEVRVYSDPPKTVTREAFFSGTAANG